MALLPCSPVLYVTSVRHNKHFDTNFVSNIEIFSEVRGGMWWRSWLRQCAKSRKVAGSIPDDVIGIFH